MEGQEVVTLTQPPLLAAFLGAGVEMEPVVLVVGGACALKDPGPKIVVLLSLVASRVRCIAAIFEEAVEGTERTIIVPTAGSLDGLVHIHLPAAGRGSCGG